MQYANHSLSYRKCQCNWAYNLAFKQPTKCISEVKSPFRFYSKLHRIVSALSSQFFLLFFQSINELFEFYIYWISPFKLISVIRMGNNITFENHIWTTSFCLRLQLLYKNEKKCLMTHAHNSTIRLLSLLKYSYINISFDQYFANDSTNLHVSEYSGPVQSHFNQTLHYNICCAFIAVFKEQTFSDLSRISAHLNIIYSWWNDVSRFEIVIISVLCQSIRLHHFIICLIYLPFNDKIFQLHVYIKCII